jgi:hypothetical protein
MSPYIERELIACAACVALTLRTKFSVLASKGRGGVEEKGGGERKAVWRRGGRK